MPTFFLLLLVVIDFAHYLPLVAFEVAAHQGLILAEELVLGRYLLVGEVALMALVRVEDHPRGESHLVDNLALVANLVFQTVVAQHGYPGVVH